jgi:dipeptidyl aminopeptidase/acylaminoacyl peptidase
MTTLAYGTWPSPLTAADVAGGSPRIEGARFVGDEIWWGESIAAEGGRGGVRRRSIAGGETSDVLPAPWSARSRVHEYGGGAWTVADGALVFVEKTDQRVWMLRPGHDPEALTALSGDSRFGGLTWQEGRLLAIRETHGGGPAPARDIVAIPLDGTGATDPTAITRVVAGSGFLAHPALAPGGERLAWIAWDHPDMPWDRSELRVGTVEDGIVTTWSRVAGGSSSPLQPEWADEDTLLFADDTSGRWNIARLTVTGASAPASVSAADADTGGPIWVLGTRWFATLADGRIVAVQTHGADRLVVIDPVSGAASALEAPVSSGVGIEDTHGSLVLVTGAGERSGPGLWLVGVDDPARVDAITGGTPPVAEEWMPRPRPVTYDGPHGPVHAFLYPPTNPVVSAPDDERPPFVLTVHGGPTAHVGPAASAKFAYLTSRGLGVLDVNYGGSSGYGRAYRERLNGQWGVVDVDDVIAAAEGLADSGAADPARIAIAGGSAGGWTVLSALTRSDAFTAGISRYGVGDARALAADSHDFEAHYLDGLIGPLPEAEALYLERSPLSHAERFRVPILLLQGADDPVVPPSQSEAIRDALAARGVPHAYVLYPGEGHGFRRSETVVDMVEREVAFLGAAFGFTPDGIAPLELD